MTASQKDQQGEQVSRAWIPENEGDTLRGTVHEVLDAWSDQRKGYYPLLIIHTPDGDEKHLHAFTTVLYNEIIRRQPMPGDPIEVVFLGIGKPSVKGQNGAKLFRISIPGAEKRQAEQAYARMAAGGRGPAPTQPPEDPSPATDDDLPY